MCFRNPIGATVLAAALMVTIGGAAAFDESKYPDLKGQWRRVGRAVQSDRIGAAFDPSKPFGRGEEAAADAGIPGHLRGEPCRYGKGRPGHRPDL